MVYTRLLPDKEVRVIMNPAVSILTGRVIMVKVKSHTPRCFPAEVSTGIHTGVTIVRDSSISTVCRLTNKVTNTPYNIKLHCEHINSYPLAFVGERWPSGYGVGLTVLIVSPCRDLPGENSPQETMK